MVPLGMVGDMALDHATASLRLAPSSRRGGRGSDNRRRRRLGSGRRDRRRYASRLRRVRSLRGGSGGGGDVSRGSSRGGLRGGGRGVAALGAAAGAGEGRCGARNGEALEAVRPDIRELHVVVDARNRNQL